MLDTPLHLNQDKLINSIRTSNMIPIISRFKIKDIQLDQHKEFHHLSHKLILKVIIMLMDLMRTGRMMESYICRIPNIDLWKANTEWVSLGKSTLCCLQVYCSPLLW